MKASTSPDTQMAELKIGAHLGRMVERIDRIVTLKALLIEEDRNIVVAILRKDGYSQMGDDIERKSLEDLRTAIRSVIEQMETWNNEIPGLSRAIKESLIPLIQENSLESDQIEWVCERIQDGYECTLSVNRPLIGQRGVPEFPSKEVILGSVLRQLTSAQVRYMMEEGRLPFTFQVKLVTPSTRVDLQRELIWSNYYSQAGESAKLLGIPKELEDNLIGKSGSNRIEWRWSFCQKQPIITREELEPWDNEDLTPEQRIKAFKTQLPKGMKGTDRFDWATDMADGLGRGMPMDEPREANKGFFTVLDEEGEFLDNEFPENLRYIICGCFVAKEKSPQLFYYMIDDFYSGGMRLRATVDGSIDAIE